MELGFNHILIRDKRYKLTSKYIIKFNYIIINYILYYLYTSKVLALGSLALVYFGIQK